MPNVVGMTSSEAAVRLRRLGILASLRDVASTQPQGTVVAQSPTAGSVVRTGASATLQVSTGQAPEPTRPPAGTPQPSDGGVDGQVPQRLGVVPDLRGLSLTGARIALVGNGLRPGAVDSQWVEGARGGRVVAQNPQAGAQVLPGSRVSITLARRSPPVVQPTRPERVAVPNLSALTVEQARARVGRARLLLGAVDSSEAGVTAPGTVFAQKPAAGDSVEPGAFVTISVTQSRRVAVPSLVGRPVAEARRMLAAAGLTAGSVGERETRGDAGRVLTQSIPARARVRPGATVDLVITRAPAVVSPDTPVASNPPARGDSSNVARQDTPVTQQTPPNDTTTAQRVDSQTSPVGQTVTQPPNQTASVDTNRPTRPAVVPDRGMRREVMWALIALLALVAAAVAARLMRRRPPPAPQPAVAATPPPVAGSARLRVSTGDWESATQADEPVSSAKLRLAVRVSDVRTVAQPGPALQPGRVTVKMVESEAPVVVTDESAPVRAGEVMRIWVRDDAPTLTIDDTPIIQGRRR